MIRRFGVRAGLAGRVLDQHIRSPCIMAAAHSGRQRSGEVSVTRAWVTEPSRRPMPPLRPLFSRLLAVDAKLRQGLAYRQFLPLQAILPLVADYLDKPNTPWAWLVNANADWGWDDVFSARVGGPPKGGRDAG